MDTVLIADRDLGFVFWLAQRLTDLGHHALPAMSIDDAAMLAEQFEFDTLIVDPSLPNAAALMKSLRRSHPLLRVLVLSSNREARFEELQDLETALRQARFQDPLRLADGSDDLGDRPGIVANRLAAPRAALTGVLVGAALWALLIGLVTPK